MGELRWMCKCVKLCIFLPFLQWKIISVTSCILQRMKSTLNRKNLLLREQSISFKNWHLIWRQTSRIVFPGRLPVLQIRRGNRNNLGIIIHISPSKHTLWPSLEPACRDDSNEGSQHMFFLIRKILWIILNNPSYLKLCGRLPNLFHWQILRYLSSFIKLLCYLDHIVSHWSRALDKREYLIMIFLISHQNRMLWPLIWTVSLRWGVTP